MFLCSKMSLSTQGNHKGRRLAINKIDSLTLAVFKQSEGIKTKKAVYNIFEPDCSYKTLVVSLNRIAKLALKFLGLILTLNRFDSHLIKHTDSTDISVCLNKNANRHKTMKRLAHWGHTGKGWFYGLKLHLTSDLKRKILAIKLTAGNVSDRTVFLKLNHNLKGLFIADAGYISKKLAQEFFELTGNILIAKPRKNMKLVLSKIEKLLYGTRMLIELNFRSLKEFYGLVTSLPRSVSGYLANYIHSLLAYCIA